MIQLKMRDRNRAQKSQNATSHVSEHYIKQAFLCSQKNNSEPSLLLKVQEN